MTLTVLPVDQNHPLNKNHYSNHGGTSTIFGYAAGHGGVFLLTHVEQDTYHPYHKDENVHWSWLANKTSQDHVDFLQNYSPESARNPYKVFLTFSKNYKTDQDVIVAYNTFDRNALDAVFKSDREKSFVAPLLTSTLDRLVKFDEDRNNVSSADIIKKMVAFAKDQSLYYD